MRGRRKWNATSQKGTLRTQYRKMLTCFCSQLLTVINDFDDERAQSVFCSEFEMLLPTADER